MLKNRMRLLRAHLKPFFVHLTTVIRKVRDERERNQLTRTLIWPSINRKKEGERRGSKRVCLFRPHPFLDYHSTPLWRAERRRITHHPSISWKQTPDLPSSYLYGAPIGASDCNVSCRPNEQHKTERLEGARRAESVRVRAIRF